MLLELVCGSLLEKVIIKVWCHNFTQLTHLILIVLDLHKDLIYLRYVWLALLGLWRWQDVLLVTLIVLLPSLLEEGHELVVENLLGGILLG